MSIYDTINQRAAANKAAAWQAIEAARVEYRATGERTPVLPLTAKELGKKQETHDIATEDDKEDELRVVYRQTEIDAVKHALGWFRFMSEDPVERLTDVVLTRYCMQCHKRHPITEFKAHSELSRFVCVKQNVEKKRYYWKRSDKVTRGVAVFAA